MTRPRSLPVPPFPLKPYRPNNTNNSTGRQLRSGPAAEAEHPPLHVRPGDRLRLRQRLVVRRGRAGPYGRGHGQQVRRGLRQRGGRLPGARLPYPGVPAPLDRQRVPRAGGRRDRGLRHLLVRAGRHDQGGERGVAWNVTG